MENKYIYIFYTQILTRRCTCQWRGYLSYKTYIVIGYKINANNEIFSKTAKKQCSPVQNGQSEKSCEIKGGSKEMAVML